MSSWNLPYVWHKLKLGIRRRCPDCEYGKLFDSHFHMVKTCPYCGSRFERSSGDSIGGVYLNIAAAELTAIGGYFIVERLFDPPFSFQLALWVFYVLGFVALFYPYGRGLWVSILYLTGAVYPDPDYEREYIAPHRVTYGKTPQEHE